MPNYTFMREMITVHYTTVEALNADHAEILATSNFDEFQNVSEGDAEWLENVHLERIED